MRWLFAFGLTCLPATAFAQTCGPDTAPSQAAAAGYTCETFRWGTGDTISEIDTGLTYAAPCANPGLSPCGGFKLYYNPINLGGYAPVLGGQVTVDGSGRILTQTSDTTQHGSFLVNTCGGPAAIGGANSPWTVGTFFQHGYYLEVVIEYNGTGHTSVQTGFYGYDGYWYNDVAHGGAGGGCPGTGSNACYEPDNPDALALSQSVNVHAGSGFFANNNNPSPLPTLPGTVETGTNKWGMLSAPSVVTWYAGNNVRNGTPGTAAFNQIGTATEFYNSKQCYGSEATAEYQLIIDSIKVWQAGGAPPAVFGGGRGLRR